MRVSIIMPLYKPDKELLRQIDNSIKNQDFKDKVEVIKVDKGLGLADSLNYGIKRAKYEIIVTLHQDCIPYSDEWLKKLVEPLKKREIVASVSKVELPKELWKKFDFLAEILTVKEAGILKPLMDEKGCAYKKIALKKAGLFDSKTFRTCGEDFDMYFKLKKQGKIAYPDCKVIHIHKTTFKTRLKKELQYAEGYGTLFRIYSIKMPRWWLAFLKSIPFLGIVIFIITYPYFKLGIKSFAFIPLSILQNFLYVYGFWSGFIRKRQII